MDGYARLPVSQVHLTPVLIHPAMVAPSRGATAEHRLPLPIDPGSSLEEPGSITSHLANTLSPRQ